MYEDMARRSVAWLVNLLQRGMYREDFIRNCMDHAVHMNDVEDESALLAAVEKEVDNNAPKWAVIP